jgi:hypothetical protein
MASNLTTVTNKSQQVVPILINEVSLANANAGSDIAATRAEQMSIPPGSEVEIETSRVDVGQLEQLQRLGLISFVSR